MNFLTLRKTRLTLISVLMIAGVFANAVSAADDEFFDNTNLDNDSFFNEDSQLTIVPAETGLINHDYLVTEIDDLWLETRILNALKTDGAVDPEINILSVEDSGDPILVKVLINAKRVAVLEISREE